jgi:PHD/YefM family antitoxin component YafN of YafNO toxin-antitoxin module
MSAAGGHPQYITDEAGHKTAVILSLDAYSELMEDLTDLAAVAERRNEKTISHEDLLAELKADGLV